MSTVAGGMTAALRQAATTFARLAGVTYACGYLVMRARARVLGIDPAYDLLDEAYVFAGFRFVFALLFALLLMLPVILALRAVAMWLCTRRAPLRPFAEAGALALLIAVTLAQFGLLGISDVLLAERDDLLVQAALKRNDAGLWLTLATTAIVALELMWLRQRASNPGGLTTALALTTVLQCLFLPIIHGGFYADRTVRILDRVPPTAYDIVAPVGVVDRARDRVTLLGNNAKGERRLVMVKQDALNGIGVEAVVPLKDFLARLPRSAMIGFVVAATPLAADAQSGPRSPPAARATTDASFWAIIVGHLNNTLSYIGSLGEGRATRGQVFVAEVEGIVARAPPRALTADRDLAWPVMAEDGVVFALRGRQLVRIAPGGGVTPLGPPADWLKLLGVGPDGTVLGLVADPPYGRPARVTPAGAIGVGDAPGSPEDERRHSVLLQESRAFADGRRLRLLRSQRGGRGLDIYLERVGAGAGSLNVSDCGSDNCGQPSLSPDGTHVLYIRATR